MASKNMTAAERRAFSASMAEAKARKGSTDPSDDSSAESLSASERIAAIDAAALALPDPDVFDPDGVYVVMQSAIGLPYGPDGEWQQPAFHGELIAAQAAHTFV